LPDRPARDDADPRQAARGLGHRAEPDRAAADRGPGRQGRLGLGESRRHEPVRSGAVPVRGDLDPAARRGGRRDRDRAADAQRRRRESSAMSDLLFNITYAHFLVLAAVLFLIGVIGVLVRRNALIILMAVELMLNAANMTLLTFSRMWGDLSGHTF